MFEIEILIHDILLINTLAAALL